MDLSQAQTRVDRWILDHGGYWDRFHILARLSEELGEVAGALQREQGLRPRHSPADLGEEVGDLLFTLIAFANVNGLELDACLGKVLKKYDIRDGEAWKAREN
ncbi:MAG: MazG nucleotide pyrophosphohydrolase domain-containing protein [Halochromatium sp.]